jgi:hypothetical protein
MALAKKEHLNGPGIIIFFLDGNNMEINEQMSRIFAIKGLTCPN